MSKPKTVTGKVLKAAGNLEHVFGSGSRTASIEHESNSLRKITMESLDLTIDATMMSLEYGYPTVRRLDPRAKVVSSVGQHERYLRPSLKEQYTALIDRLKKLRDESIPRLSPGVLGLLMDIEQSGGVNEISEAMAYEHLEESNDDHLELFSWYDKVGGEVGASRFSAEEYNDLGFRDAIMLAFSNMWMPDYLSRQPNGLIVMSPLGLAAADITSKCLQAAPPEPLC